MYTDQTIDHVRNADIVQVIGNLGVTLKQAGIYREAISPFNPNDKTPSFKINTTKNNWVCYSTNQMGDGIKFVRLLNKCSFADAVKTIAGICNITLMEEPLSEEAQRKRDRKTEMFSVMEQVADQYKKAFRELDSKHWAKELAVKRGFTAETIINFGLGYAPATDRFITVPLTDKGKFEIAKTLGLSKVNKGTGNDFFIDRVMFPIQDHNGNVLAFGGRAADLAGYAKYINSPETEIYSKTAVLYGLFQAKTPIAKSGMAVLVEGYTDVTAMHQNGCDIAVASCGTALTDEQCKLLAKVGCHHVIVCRDNDGVKANGDDGAGTKATLRDIDKLLSHGFSVSVCILPENEDPDSFSRILDKRREAGEFKGNMKTYVMVEKEDAVIWKARHIKRRAGDDPYLISEAVKLVAQMLYQIKDDVARTEYIKKAAKTMGQSSKLLKDDIEVIKAKIIENAQKKGAVADQANKDLGLPEGADYRDFLKNEFTVAGNCYHFKGREKFFPGTNFIFKPLYFAVGGKESKRICEVINVEGEQRLIDLEPEHLTNYTAMEKRLINLGNFKFLQNTTAVHFRMIRTEILNNFQLAHEITDLGWQDKGFFSYADSIFYKGILKMVNDYGIVQLDESLSSKSTYHQTSNLFYLPAFSEMHKHDSANNDEYENDRYFVFRQSPVSLNEWMLQLKKVYGEKAILGICFIMATLFRDIFIKRYQHFPHMFLTGEKGSGKSKFGESLAAMFTYKQPAFDLNAGTIVALYRRLARIMNAPTMIEEFHDAIDMIKFQALKGASDGRGREMGKATGDNKTVTTNVNCSCIILGQYLSARDDNSLTTRSLLQHFIKPTDSYTTAQIEDYAKLKGWEEVGLNSLIKDILMHREYVEQNLHSTMATISKTMKKELEGSHYEERMLQNYLTIIAPVNILRERGIDFPFTHDEMWLMFKNAIVDSSDLIIESEGLAQFWNVLEFLLENVRIKTNVHFKIDTPAQIRLQTRKGEKEEPYDNNPRKRILFLRLNTIHQHYHKEVSTRDGVDVIGENTLKNYFKSKRYYIGSVKSHRFEDTSTSAFCFDYDMMEEHNILNLIREKKDPFEGNNTDPAQTEIETTTEGAPNDDLPF